MEKYDNKYILSHQQSYEHFADKCFCGMRPNMKWHVDDRCVGPFDALVSRIPRDSYIFAYDYEKNFGHKFETSEKKTAKGFLAVKDRRAFLLAHKDKSPHLNEVIQEGRKCVFVCDIDGCPIIGAEDVEFFEQTFREHFATLWTIENMTFQFIWLSSNKEKTGSYHVLIHCTANGESYGFADLKDQKGFWELFPRNGVFADVRSGKKMVPVIDFAIYSKNRGLRTIYSTKIGQNRPIKYWNVAERDTIKPKLWQTFVLQEVTHTFDISVFTTKFGYIPKSHKDFTDKGAVDCGKFINLKPLIIDILSKTKRNFTSRAMWIKMNCDLKYLLGEEGYDISTEFFKSQGWDSESEIYTNQEMYRSLPIKQITTINAFADFCGVTVDIETDEYIPSEIIGELSAQDIQIQQWLTNCHIDFKKKSAKFITKLVSMLSSFLGANFRAIAGKFIALNIKTIAVLTYVEELYLKPCEFKYPITDLSIMLEASSIVWNEEYDEEKVRDYPEQNDRHIFVRSGTGTGKTYKIFKQYGLIGKKILVVSYRRSLARNVHSNKLRKEFEGLDWGLYDDPKISNGSRVPQILICQLESLHKFYETIDKFDMIVFDECENIIMQLSHLKGHNQITRTRLLLKNIMKKRAIYFISANLGCRTFNFVRRYSEREIYSIKNNYKDKAGYKIELYLGWQERVKELAKAGKKLAIAINSKSGAKNLADAMREIYGADKVLCMIGESDKKKETKEDKEEAKIIKKTNEQIMNNVNVEWTKYKCVIYTSCVEAGVSYEVEGHFDYICASFKKKTNDWIGKYQGLFRVRSPNKKTIIMELPEDYGDDKYYPTSKTQLIRMVNFDNFMKEMSLDERIAFTGKDLYKLEVDLNDELNQQLMDNIQFQKYSDHYLKSLMLNELRDAGAVILPGKENTEIVVDKKGVEKVKFAITEEQKQERARCKEMAQANEVKEIIHSNEANNHRNRSVLIESGIIAGTVEQIIDNYDFRPIAKFTDEDDASDKIIEIREQHGKSINKALTAIYNYRRVNRFHLYFDKVKHIKGLANNWNAIAELEKLTERGGREDRSASKSIIEVHKLIEVFGFYTNAEYTKDELREKLRVSLFDENNTWDLLNTTFKSAHASNRITPKLLAEKEDPYNKMKRYIDGILKSHNLKFDLNNSGKYSIQLITDIKVETFEDFKNDFDKIIIKASTY